VKHVARDIQAVLIDLDGVMYVEEQLIPGALEAIEYLRDHNIPHRFLTNTTITSKNQLLRKMHSLHIPATKEQIISPPGAAVRFLEQQGSPRVHLVLMDSTREDFAQFPEDDENPDYVILGKIGDRWNYDILNRVFRMLINGATLIALHKDRYTQQSDGLWLEFGAFVAGLEYATGQDALVIGKPSPAFYQSALDDLQLPAHQVAMIGDDLISDIQGSQNLGLHAVLVQTGKFRDDLLQKSNITPDRLLPSIADIQRLFS
jgi:HAD superfamily hydrolase (TIGR01458 family)